MPGPSNKKATTKKKKTTSYTKSIPAINSVANPSKSPTTGKYTEEYKENICEAAISEFIATEDKIFALTEFFYIAFGLGRLTADAKSVEDAEKEAKSRRNAYEAGKKDGQSRGYAEGFEEGQESGYQDACDQGFLMENAYHMQPPSTSASTQTAPSACVSASVQTDATQATPRRACIATQTTPIYASTSTQTTLSTHISASVQTDTTPTRASTAAQTEPRTRTRASTQTPTTNSTATQTKPRASTSVFTQTTPPICASASGQTTPPKMAEPATKRTTSSSGTQTALSSRENASRHTTVRPPSPKTTRFAPGHATSSLPTQFAPPLPENASERVPSPIPTRPHPPETGARASTPPPFQEPPPPLEETSIHASNREPTVPAPTPHQTAPTPAQNHDAATQTAPYAHKNAPATTTPAHTLTPKKTHHASRSAQTELRHRVPASIQTDPQLPTPTPAPDRSTPAPAHSHNVAVQMPQLRTLRPSDVETRANANARPIEAGEAKMRPRNDVPTENETTMEQTTTRTREMSEEVPETATSEYARQRSETAQQEVTNDPVRMSNPTPASMPAPPTRFDWAEDAATIPLHPVFTNRYPPRDLSALRSNNQRPFATLQRRTRQPLWRTQPHLRRPYPGFHESRFTRGLSNTRPFHPPYPTPPKPTYLDWDRDPRLLDLSRALQALGWKKPR